MATVTTEAAPILVIGGGIAGLTAANEAAETGNRVIIVEKEAYLGGRAIRLAKYFPKLCPPYCGFEINLRRIKQNPDVTVHTLAQVEAINGVPGEYTVTIHKEPRYVNQRCTACSDCVPVCPEERPNDFNYGMDTTKAIYLPHDMAFPMKYALDMVACQGSSCNKCVEVCKYDAIDLTMKAETLSVKVAAIVVATGWKPYDPSRMDNLGFGTHPDILSNVMFERLATDSGPTQGKILRRSDGKPAKRVAFVHCAGSRDENHLAYCSSICCMSSLKEGLLVKEQYPDADVTSFYIDIRTPGRYEDFFETAKAAGINLIKGKVAKIEPSPDGRSLTVIAEDAISAKKVHKDVDLVVLATGMQPSLAGSPVDGAIDYDEAGFIMPSLTETGIFAVGCAKAPVDVTTATRDATAAALRSIQQLVPRS